jgi:hypothetical protein
MRLLAVGLAIWYVFSALPVSAQQPADREAIKASAAAAAVELSRLEVAGQFDELYDLMHPDAQAIIPRAAVVGWYTNDFAPLHAGVSKVFSTLLVPWTWDVNGTTYWDAATVVYQQPFGDGSVAQGQVHLVAVDGQWRWFFGKSRDFVDEQIAKYTTTPTPVPTSTPSPTPTPRPTQTPLPTSTPIPTSTPMPTPTPTATANPAQMADPSDTSRIAALETQTAGLQNALNEEQIRNAVLATQVADLQGRVLALERQSPASAPAPPLPTTPGPATLPATISVAAATTPTGSPTPTATPIPTPTATPVPTLTPSPTPTPTPPPPTMTPTAQPTTGPGACTPLSDVRDLAVRTRNYLGKKIAFDGVVLTLFDTGQPVLLGDNDPKEYAAQMQVIVPAPDGSSETVMVGVNADTAGIFVNSTVHVCGTVVDTASGENALGGTITQPLVSAESIGLR